MKQLIRSLVTYMARSGGKKTIELLRAHHSTNPFCIAATLAWGKQTAAAAAVVENVSRHIDLGAIDDMGGEGLTKLERIHLRKFEFVQGDIQRAFDLSFEEFASIELSDVLKWPLPRVSDAQRRFFEAVRDRKIAVVGPIETSGVLPDLSTYAMVARVGFAGPDSVPIGSGDRCDVSFYAPHKARSLVVSVSPDVVRGCAFLIAKNEFAVHELRNWLGDAAAESLIVMSKYPASLFRYTKPNALPELLLNILAGCPRQVSIFGVDLFTSQNYAKGYLRQSDLGEAIDSTRRSFAIHDPISHFRFFSALRDLPQVNFSSPLLEVVDGGLERYRTRLYALYGNPGAVGE